MSDINPLLTQSPTINPYRYGAFEIWNRLKWDINPESWRSRSKIKFFKNKYSGQKAVIVCNGPSLLKTDLSLLKETFTFGLNKINLIFDKSDFRPSCIVAVNSLVIEQNKDFYNSTNIDLFIDRQSNNLIQTRKNVIFLHSASQHKFAMDCSFSIHIGFTVTYVAMQLAFHMGFSKVALIGCDHNFATKGIANTIVVSDDEDKNHFDPKYFSGGMKWQLPDLSKSEVGYILARDIFNLHGRKLFNATEGGKLEVLKRIELTDFLNI